VFEDLKRARRTIVLVSHDLASVQRFCERAYWLDKGRLVMAGDASEVVQSYLAVSQSLGPDSAPLAERAEGDAHRFGDGRIRFVEGRLEDERGQPLTRVQAGSRVVLRLAAEPQQPCVDPVFGFFVRLGGQTVYSTNTFLFGHQTGEFLPGDRVLLRIPFIAGLANGRYILDVAVGSYADRSIHDWVANLLTFTVEDSRCADGVADLAAEFECTLVSPDLSRRIQLRPARQA